MITLRDALLCAGATVDEVIERAELNLRNMMHKRGATDDEIERELAHWRGVWAENKRDQLADMECELRDWLASPDANPTLH